MEICSSLGCPSYRRALTLIRATLHHHNHPMWACSDRLQQISPSPRSHRCLVKTCCLCVVSSRCPPCPLLPALAGYQCDWESSAATMRPAWPVYDFGRRDMVEVGVPRAVVKSGRQRWQH